MSTLNSRLTKQLDQRKTDGNYRNLTPPLGGVDFYSNDYLGFASSRLLDGHMNLDALPYGSTGSRLISGNHASFEALEQLIATHHKAEAALLFNSGYDANLGLLTAIAGRHTVFIYDELCHASIIDGVRASLCGGKCSFQHNNIADLERQLERHKTASELIVIIETVYSMDGDIPPLQAIANLCATYGAHLIADEAHATGVFGEHGEGMVVQLGLEKQVYARVHTFGKALGCHGAAVVGDALLKNYLINYSRPFVYTTALPPASIGTAIAAYHYLQSAAFSNQPLHELIAYFNQQKINLATRDKWLPSTSPIQVLMTGSNDSSRSLAATLIQEGLNVKPIMSPTVAKGKERIRVCLHSFNNTAEVDKLFDLVEATGIKRNIGQ